jgi:hypothetical protein
VRISRALLERRRVLGRDLHDQVPRVRGLEGKLARQRFVEDHAHAVDVGRRIDLHHAAGLLRRHVLRRPEKRSVACHARADVSSARNAEVEELREATIRVFDQEDVVGLEVAVNDPCFVHDREPPEAERYRLRRLLERQRCGCPDPLS